MTRGLAATANHFSITTSGREHVPTGTRSGVAGSPLMTKREYARVISLVEELKVRILTACLIVERRGGDKLLEATAELRNLVMQLDAVKLQLRKSRFH